LNRRLLVPLLILSALAAILFLWDLPAERRQAEQLQQDLSLSRLDPALVDTLRIERGDAAFTVARQGGGWRLLSPVEETADASAVRGMVSAFCRARSLKLIDATADTTALEAYGLGGLRPAVRRVVLVSSGRPPLIYEFGRSNPSGRGHYLRVVGTTRIHLVDNQLFELSRTSYQALRVYDLFPLQPEEIDRLAVDRQKVHYRARKNERGLWFTVEDRPRQLKRRMLHTLAYDLCEARIQEFVQDQVDEKTFAAYGLQPPFIDLRFRAGGREYRLRVGNTTGEGLSYARRGDEASLLTINSQLLESTAPSLEELLETNPVPDNYTLLDSVQVVWHTGQSVTAFPVGGDHRRWDLRWPAAAPRTSPDAFLVAARNLYYGLEELSSDETVLLPDEARVREYLVTDKVRCELYWPDRTVRYEIGWRPGEDAHWLHVLGEKKVYRIPRDLFFRLRGVLLTAGVIDPHS